MPVLTVGKAEIPYEIRWSEKASRRRIVVTPGLVEVVAPPGGDESGIQTFVERKRRWVFEKVQSVEKAAREIQRDAPAKYATGAKVLYRGRRMKLTVTRGDVDRVEVSCRSDFQVQAPAGVGDREIKAALDAWLKDRLLRDVHDFVRLYSPKIEDRSHGKAFWGMVARVMPEYEVGKRWLAREGRGLE